MEPLVSIITPCYNHETFLPEYFHGLLTQTYTNLEIIIVDDASLDDSWNIILHNQSELETRFVNVRCVQNKSNLGFFESLIQAQKEVSGELVCFLESDDFYYPKKIEENVTFLDRHRDFGAVHSRAHYYLADEDRVDRNYRLRSGEPIPEGDIFEALLKDNFILTCTFCCRTDLLHEHVRFEEYKKAGYLMGDYPMFLDLARFTNFGYIDQALAGYRVRTGSASNPSDPEKLFRFKKSYYHIKLSYCERFVASQKMTERALKQSHRLLYTFGIEHFSRSRFEAGYAWLRVRYPSQYDTLRSSVYAFSLRYRWLWMLVRRLDNMRVVNHLYLTLKSIVTRKTML